MANTIEVLNSDSDVIRLKITGPQSQGEAQLAAEEWCDENNSLIKKGPAQHPADDVNVFYVEVGSDDYK